MYNKISRNYLQLERYLDELYLTSEMGIGKFNENFYHHIFEKEKISSENSYMIGDDLEFDILSIIKAGGNGILLKRGDEVDIFSENIKTKKLEKEKEYPVVNNLEEVINILKKI